jgi:competence protein ComEC
LVFRLRIEEDSYLFTGDIEFERELELIQNYDVKADYIKSPHHGSDTSSSLAFLQAVDPKEAYVTSFYKNTHGHPSSSVMNLYQDMHMTIYRIDLDGTIQIRYIFHQKQKITHPPQ